jgi:hypothetical protein
MTDPDLDMPTTIGSHAFATAKARKAAWVADRVNISTTFILDRFLS